MQYLQLNNNFNPHLNKSSEYIYLDEIYPNYNEYKNEDWGTAAGFLGFYDMDYFNYIKDVIDALISAKDHAINKGVIQIGPDKSTSIKEIAEEIVRISKKNIEIVLFVHAISEFNYFFQINEKML